MTTWTIPVSEYTAEQASYYEDQYHKLKSEKDGTARRLNELDNANRMLRTKCAQLETFKKTMMDGEDKGQLAESFRSMSKHDKSSYDDLFKAYDIIQRQHRSLIAKNKSYLQHIGKLKKEVQTAKLRFGAPRLKNNRASNSIIKPNNGDSVEVASVDNKENVEHANVDSALAQLQSRLNNAEAQLIVLKSNPLAADRTANVRLVTFHLFSYRLPFSREILLPFRQVLRRQPQNSTCWNRSENSTNRGYRFRQKSWRRSSCYTKNIKLDTEH